MQTVNGFWDMLEQYTGKSVVYLFVILAWIFFLFEMDKKSRKAVILAFALLLVTIFNPYSYNILIKLTGQYKTYYRLLWIFPCEIALSFFIYKSMDFINNTRHKLAIISIFCILSLFIFTNKENWKFPENSYQISSETIEVAESLKLLREEEGQERVTILADTNICHSIREYDANICLPFSFYVINDLNGVKGNVPAIMSMLMNNQNNWDTSMVIDTLESNNIDYLVINISNDVSLAYMQQLHWQIVATTTSYHILQYQDS